MELPVLVEEVVRMTTRLLANVAEGVAAVIIAHATATALVRYAKNAFDPTGTPGTLAIRLNLGKGLALTLEFLLAADILRTAVSPTWEDIGKLGAIAAIRTILNFFLERELKHDPEFKTT